MDAVSIGSLMSAGWHACKLQGVTCVGWTMQVTSANAGKSRPTCTILPSWGPRVGGPLSASGTAKSHGFVQSLLGGLWKLRLILWS